MQISNFYTLQQLLMTLNSNSKVLLVLWILARKPLEHSDAIMAEHPFWMSLSCIEGL